MQINRAQWDHEIRAHALGIGVANPTAVSSDRLAKWLSDTHYQHPRSKAAPSAKPTPSLSQIQTAYLRTRTVDQFRSILGISDDDAAKIFEESNLQPDTVLGSLTIRKLNPLREGCMLTRPANTNWSKWARRSLTEAVNLERPAVAPPSAVSPAAKRPLPAKPIALSASSSDLSDTSQSDWSPRRLFTTAVIIVAAVAALIAFGPPFDDQEPRAATTEETDTYYEDTPDLTAAPENDPSEAEAAEPETSTNDSSDSVPTAIADYGVDEASWRVYVISMLDAGYLTDSEAAYPENLESVGFTGLAQCEYFATKSASQLAQEETDEFGTPISQTSIFFNAAEELCAAAGL